MKSIRDINLVIGIPKGGGGEDYEVITTDEIDEICEN